MPIWGAFQLGICCSQDSMETCLAGNPTQMAEHGSSWQACHLKTKTWVALLTQSWEKLGKGVLWNLFVFCLLYFKKTWNCHLATCKCKTNISLRQNMKDITRENIPILFFDLFWNSNGSSKRFREKSPWLVRHMSELHRRRFTSRGWSNWTNWSMRNINVRCKFFSPRWVMVSQEAVRN